MSGRSTAVLLLLHLTPGSLLQFQHLVVVRVVETLLPRHLKPEVIDCSQPVYCTALALVQHDLADSVDGDIRPLSPLKVPVVTVVLDNPFKVTNQTFEQICDIIGVLPVKVRAELELLPDHRPANSVRLQSLDSPHALLHGSSAARNSRVKGVANNFKVFWEVRLGKKRGRGRDCASHQVWVFLPVPGGKRAGIGSSKGDPGTYKAFLFPHGKSEGSKVSQGLP